MSCLIAQRYDRLGGRLSSLSFALFIRRAYGFEVRMSWPYGRIHPMHITPEDVFSAEFLHGRMMDPKDVRKILRQQENEPDTPPYYRIIEALDKAEIPPDLDPGPIGPFSDVLPVAYFSEPIQEAMQALTRQHYSGVHIRHGDLVDGQWRHYGYMERFVPFDATLHFIQNTCAPGEFRVHSDDPKAANHMSELADRTGVTDYRFVASRAFDGVDQDVFDIFHMACAQQIIAPQKSAYSGFAARYYGRPRHDQTPQALQAWAEEHINAPKDMISPFYSVKRHLFIIRMLQELGVSDKYVMSIDRMLSHVEATEADNAELYLQKMRFFRASTPFPAFEADLAAYVDMMEDLKTFMPARGGAVRLMELIAELEPDDRRVAPMKEAIKTIHPVQL